MTIYKIVNNVNNKVYIGQTRKPANLRFNNHKYDLRKGTHFNSHLQRSWNKYGESAFDFIIIEEEVVDLDSREIFWISYFDSANSQKGFNRHLGGSSNRVISDSTRAKISASLLGNTRTRGKKASPESIEKRRKAMLGHKFGPHSEETKLKISNALRGSKSLHWGKPGVNRKSVLCVTTGQIFESATEAAKSLRCDRSSICAVCRGELKHTKNYTFTYVINI